MKKRTPMDHLNTMVFYLENLSNILIFFWIISVTLHPSEVFSFNSGKLFENNEVFHLYNQPR